MLLREDANFILAFFLFLFDGGEKKMSTKPPGERLRRGYSLKQRSFLASNIKALPHIKKTKEGRKKNKKQTALVLMSDCDWTNLLWPEFEKLTIDLK